MNDAISFFFVWGVWLITPMLVDGVDAVSRLVVVWRSQKSESKRDKVEDWQLPRISVIVPAHNEEAVIDRCLYSLKAQDYPSDKLEIIVVDDGSTDATAERVDDHVNGEGSGNGYRLRGKPIKIGPFSGRITLIKNGHAGKAHTLNAGIRASDGEIIVNIDSDVVLAYDAIRRIAEAFVRDPEMGAATGNIEIDWDVLEERDEDGRVVLDEDGHIVAKKLSAMERFLATSQFLEYLCAFDLGRRSQAVTGTLYTLAGACSAFRRDMVGQGLEYDNTSVSEDTNLTFDLHRRGVKIGFVSDARIYLEPVVEWDALYAQRVRWARGQIEVCGLNEDLVGAPSGQFGKFALPKMLLLDHTMAFPRLVWAPLLLFFPLIGYPWRIVALALIAMYAFYLLIEVVNAAVVSTMADDHTKSRLEDAIWAIIGMPIYRFFVFHFRFSGFLVTFTEKQQWTVSGPVQTTRNDLQTLRLRAVEIVTMLSTVTAALALWATRNAQMIIGPALAGLILSTLDRLPLKKWW